VFIPKIQKFYEAFWKERWPALESALLSPGTQVIRRNQFADNLNSRKWPKPFPFWNLPNCYQMEPEFKTDIQRADNGLLEYYILDPGSVLIAQTLPLGERILDMCAAPGGKTLILAERMSNTSEIIANEPHPDRRRRLTKNIRGYLPEPIRNRIWVSGKKGGLFAKSAPETFNSILIDAPCSGERFLIQESLASQELWNEKRSQKLAQEQYNLLTSGFYALKPGGFVLFSTCSLSPLEGDPVVERLKQKKGDFFDIIRFESDVPYLEPTPFGYRILPDKSGMGPFYLTLLQKKT
jgi:16S rRNA C967 or C1407 C5-methylase (RsmB/RsmF family)